jgi:predicted nucleic acid-binding protein
MSEKPEVLVFDTGPLSHFTQQGWLGILRLVVGERQAVIPDTVVAELQAGAASRPYLRLVLDASWIDQRDLTSDNELREFAWFASLLVAGDQNRGEAGVLAYAKANGALAVTDDGPGRKAAKNSGVHCRGTLGLLCDAIRDGHLTVELVSTVANHLIESEYRLPFKSGDFAPWAREHGLI